MERTFEISCVQPSKAHQNRNQAVPSLWGQVRLLSWIRHLHGKHPLYPVCWSYWNWRRENCHNKDCGWTSYQMWTTGQGTSCVYGQLIYVSGVIRGVESPQHLCLWNIEEKQEGCPRSHKDETETTNISSNLQEERGVPAVSSEVPRQAGCPHAIHHSWGHHGSFEQEGQKQQWVCCKTSLYCGLFQRWEVLTYLTRSTSMIPAFGRPPNGTRNCFFTCSTCALWTRTSCTRSLVRGNSTAMTLRLP